MTEVEDPVPSADGLFQSIMDQEGVFYRQQQRDEAELTQEEKRTILKDFFESKPAIFLQRYHSYISPRFSVIFDKSDFLVSHYLAKIEEKAAVDVPGSKAAIALRNRRFLQLQKLKKEGNYFSNEKMREREPALFDSMVGRFLDDSEKLYLRPTVDRPEGTWSNMLERFDEAGRIANRRKRQLRAEWDMPCSSNEAASFISHAGTRVTNLEEFEEINGLDEEAEEAIRTKFPKHCSKDDVDVIVRKFRRTDIQKPPSFGSNAAVVETNKTKSVWGEFDDEQTTRSRTDPCVDDDGDIEFNTTSIGEQDEDDADNEDLSQFPKEYLRAEFIAHMENRFLAGDDAEFFDYNQGDTSELDKIREQDLEDAYFDVD